MTRDHVNDCTGPFDKDLKEGVELSYLRVPGVMVARLRASAYVVEMLELARKGTEQVFGNNSPELTFQVYDRIVERHRVEIQERDKENRAI